MEDKFNQLDKKIIKLLKESKEEFLLTQSEKSELKDKLINQIKKSVTKPKNKRYSLWSYKLNIKGVIMPVLPIVLALLLAGGVGTAALADDAAPGDALYGVDQFMEQVQESMPMAQSHRARFLGRLNEERAEELATLQSMSPEEMQETMRVRWEEHRDEAIERLSISIEKVEAVQAKFQEKLVSAETEDQKEVFQEVIDHLDGVVAKSESRMTEMENGEFPEGRPLPVRQRVQEWQRESEEVREQIRNQIQEYFGEDRGLGVGNAKGNNDENSNKGMIRPGNSNN